MKSTEVHMKFWSNKGYLLKTKKNYLVLNSESFHGRLFYNKLPPRQLVQLRSTDIQVKSSNNADTFIFGSPEIKALVSFSGYVFSGVFLFVCLSVRKPFKFSTFSLEPLGTKRSTKHYWVKEIQVCYMRVMSFFKGR